MKANNSQMLQNRLLRFHHRIGFENRSSTHLNFSGTRSSASCAAKSLFYFYDRHACECKLVDTDSMAPAKQGAARSWLECLDMLLMSRALGVIRRYCNRLWIFCGDYAFRVFDRHPRGKRDIVEDQSKAKLLPPMCTQTFIYDILYCLK